MANVEDVVLVSNANYKNLCNAISVAGEIYDANNLYLLSDYSASSNTNGQIYITSEYFSSGSGYRIGSNGILECGGLLTTPNAYNKSTTVTNIPVTNGFADTNYTVIVSSAGTDTVTNKYCYQCGLVEKTNTSFCIRGGAYNGTVVRPVNGYAIGKKYGA